MSHPRPAPFGIMTDIVGPTALGLALAVCMPLLGIVALMLRGVAVALVAVVVGLLVIVGLWHLISPALSPRCRAVVTDYAAPVAFAVALVVAMPLLGIVALVVRGTILALLLVAAAVGALVLARRSYTAHHPRLAA